MRNAPRVVKPRSIPSQKLTNPCACEGLRLMGRTGLEHIANIPVKTGVSNSVGAESGAVSNCSVRIDNELQQIINSWVGLPKPLRKGILDMVKGYQVGYPTL